MGFNELTPRQRLTNNSKCRQPLCTLFYWRRLRPTGTASDKEKKKKMSFYLLYNVLYNNRKYQKGCADPIPFISTALSKRFESESTEKGHPQSHFSQSPAFRIVLSMAAFHLCYVMLC